MRRWGGHWSPHHKGQSRRPEAALARCGWKFTASSRSQGCCGSTFLSFGRHTTRPGVGAGDHTASPCSTATRRDAYPRPGGAPSIDTHVACPPPPPPPSFCPPHSCSIRHPPTNPDVDAPVSYAGLARHCAAAAWHSGRAPCLYPCFATRHHGRGNAEAAATNFALSVDACVAQVGTLQVCHAPRATPSPVVGEGSGAPSAACVPVIELVVVPVVDGDPSQRLPEATIHICGNPT